MSGDQVVTRFAPSPTGALHVGGARTALFSWAYARQHGGQFILRMEDTDRARSTDDSARRIIADLRWLGLDWDQGPRCPAKWTDALSGQFEPKAGQIGDRGPYYQSERLEIYGGYVEQLLDAGGAYRDGDAVRFRMDGDVQFDDAVYGRIEVKEKELEDFVIRKSDGFPTFHLAVVVDDALMGVTHVIRGQEHLTNTTKHVALQDALGFNRPVFAHTPSIMNPDGSKMSKRDKAKRARLVAKDHLSESGVSKSEYADALEMHDFLLEQFLELSKSRIPDQQKSFQHAYDSEAIAGEIARYHNITLPEIDVSDFRESGFLPQVLLNYIALLGWNPGNDIERFDMAFFIDHFKLADINKSNARFDREKLLSFNADTIAQLQACDWLESLRKHFEYRHLADLQKLGDSFESFANAYQKRSHTLDEPLTLGRFFIDDDEAIEYDPKAVSKVLAKNNGEGFDVLAGLAGALQDVEPWAEDAINAAVHGFAEARNMGMKKVAQPLRVAVSGGTVSPPIDQTLAILGKASTLGRIERCLALRQYLGPGESTGAK